MDENTQHPPMQGDDELAKALQGGLQFEETPVPGGDANAVAPSSDAPTMSGMPPAPTADAPAAPADTTEPASPILPQPQEESAAPASDEPSEPPAIKHTHAKNDKSSSISGNGALDKLKASALEELRPLVGKLDLPPEEKFDTLLLIIRTTDDQSLLDEAHDAAKNISDDSKRAQALLDIIKEIDYFSTKRDV